MARSARVTVVADSGAIYALIDRTDAWHVRVKKWWREHGRFVVVPVTVLPEVAYLLQTRIGPTAELAFARSIADGELVLEALDEGDLPRIADLMHAYNDLPLGFVDASVVATAERLETRDVLTTDRRHFGVVRPSHARSFTLLP